MAELFELPLIAFNGLFQRGIADTIPLDHAKDCLNLEFEPGQCRTRRGLNDGYAPAVTWPIKRFTYVNGWILVLTIDGAFFVNDVGGYLGTGSSDFAAVPYFLLTYIYPINTTPASKLLVLYTYLGTTYVRLACGNAPTSDHVPPLPTLTTTADSDIVNYDALDVGLHRFAVAYRTASGFITPPGLADSQFVADGAHSVVISDIPIGPTATPANPVIGRYILGTKADETEYFFIPGGYIPNNTDTSVHLGFYDASLVASADYLFDLRVYIPSGTSVCIYKNRLVVATGTELWVSRVSDPESFSTVDGIIRLPGGNTGAVFVLRDSLYISSTRGFFATQEVPGQEPSSWPVSLVDDSVIVGHYGVGAVNDIQAGTVTGDVVMLGTRDGLVFFDGIVRKPELSWKIASKWIMAKQANYYGVTVAVDAGKNRVYVLLPTGTSPAPDLLLMGDFTEGMTSDKLKWCEWRFLNNVKMSCMEVTPLPGAGNEEYWLRVASADANKLKIWGLDPTRLSDATTTTIESFWKSAPVTAAVGFVSCFVRLIMRVLGVGTLALALEGEDESLSVSPPGFTLTATPGVEFQRHINFTNEKMCVKVGTNAVGNYFILQRMIVRGYPRWPNRPG